MRILHISDLHTTSPNFIAEWGETVVRNVRSLNPDVVVVTGDLTDNGHVHEYDTAKAWVDRFDADNVLLVPGNHDARNMGYRVFKEMFGTRMPFFENDRIVVLGIDSTEPDLDDGHVGREKYDFIREKLGRTDRLKFLAMHHHLVPIPGTGRERHIPVDSGDVLNLCLELGIDFVLSGHKHVHWVWRIENTYLVTAGTATSRRLKGRSWPSFNILDIEDRTAILREMNVATEAVHEVRTIPLQG